MADANNAEGGPDLGDLSGLVDTPLPPLAAPDTPVSPPAPRRGGFLAALLGGALAALGGFALAQYLPPLWPQADIPALQAQLAAQTTELQALKAQMQQLADRPAADPALADRLTALEARPAPDLAPIDQRLAGLEQQLAAIAALPKDGQGASPAVLVAQDQAIKALQAELVALKAAGGVSGDAKVLADQIDARLQAAEAAATKLQSDTLALAKATAQQAALGRLQAALDSGAPYAAALVDLGEVPAVLAQNAAQGLPSLARLQAGFPDAARLALDAALRANMGQSWTERVTNLLRTQTGARSLTPREGTDPDAILSRAEAALAKGDLPAALTELDALPPEAQAALTDWRGLAETRQAAVQAVADLAAAMGK